MVRPRVERQACRQMDISAGAADDYKAIATIPPAVILAASMSIRPSLGRRRANSREGQQASGYVAGATRLILATRPGHKEACLLRRRASFVAGPLNPGFLSPVPRTGLLSNLDRGRRSPARPSWMVRQRRTA